MGNNKIEKNKKKFDLSKFALYIIFGLGFLLIASIILNIFMYYKSRIRVFDCNLGENIEVEFNESDNILLANIVYPSNIVSGTKYDQKVLLKTGDIDKTYYVRAKAIYADYNLVNNSITVELSANSSWQKNEDNYYYLKAKIEDYSEIEFINSLTIPIVPTSVKNNTIITIIFELLDTSLDSFAYWNVSPTIFS